MIEPEFQRAVFQKLGSVAGGRIYDRAPQVERPEEQEYPYVTFGRFIVTSRDGSRRYRKGFDISFRLHTFDRSGLEVRGVQAAIYEILHGGDMGMTYFPTVFVSRNDTDVMHEPDRISHGVCEYLARCTWSPWLFDENGILRPEGRILPGETI
ncbi:DUF3168 domain-containing protein [Dinoroseobacter sp. S375]|uniref:DUF3168 domain-containing protein n=1 Tax=Dinoroseobacter sp. S375 TaxID=3415136 RepID=UPI003C7E12ED